MKNLDRFRGCLIGGAAGDALGYAVEFDDIRQIRKEFGENGITQYQLSGGLARFSDDTQMTLFTANGLLNAAARGVTNYAEAVGLAYRDWYLTQRPRAEFGGKPHCWLMNVPELHALRAPGNTCLSALAGETLGTPDAPVNHSKGCGGVMRVAPVGLFLGEGASAAEVQRLGAQAAALTHGHELGWLCAAALAHMVHMLAYAQVDSVESAARTAMRAMPSAFPEATHTGEMIRQMDRALKLARSGRDNMRCLGELGEGWVGDEALSIALYCAVKYEDDFDAALIAAVNHSGDSDSTGAICGNLLGARLGLAGIPQKYQDKLELRGVILEIAGDLFAWPERVAVTIPAAGWLDKYLRASYRPEGT